MAVRNEATTIMAERARERFGLMEIPQPVVETELCPLGTAIAIAAATAAHSVPALKRFITLAGERGLGEVEVTRAVRIGRTIGETAARELDEAAHYAATAAPADPAEPKPCGCEQEAAAEEETTRRWP
jgi:hypothetical protein